MENLLYVKVLYVNNNSNNTHKNQEFQNNNINNGDNEITISVSLHLKTLPLISNKFGIRTVSILEYYSLRSIMTKTKPKVKPKIQIAFTKFHVIAKNYNR